MPNSALAVALMRMFKGILKEQGLLGVQQSKQGQKLEDSLYKIDVIFVFSLIWTVGGTIDEAGRKLYDQYLKKILKDAIKCENKGDKIIKVEKLA